MSERTKKPLIGGDPDQVSLNMFLGELAFMGQEDLELDKYLEKSSVVQEAGDSEDAVMSQKAVTEALDGLIVAPIGMCYTQYPGTDTPSTLFGGTWTLMFNDDGVFFRTEGQGASSFGGGVQGDAIRNISGSFRAYTYGDGGGKGSFTSSINNPEQLDVGSNEYRHYNSFSFSASRVVPTASENRPRNRTVRVWRKTAH